MKSKNRILDVEFEKLDNMEKERVQAGIAKIEKYIAGFFGV
jgi:hypothetical protein